MSHQELEITFVPPNTIRCTLTLYEFDRTTPITDCSTHSVKAVEPDGTEHSEETSPTNNSDGTYTQDFIILNTDPLGVYDLIWSITYDAKPSTEKVQFKVK